MTDDGDTRPHVVVIGGGFGGLYAARALADAPVRITLLDRHNYHLFQPLLYQVATASLNPSDIAAPIRWILRRQANVTVLLAEARAIDTARKVVTLNDGELAYDALIVAAGATHSYFGHDDWAVHARGLKSIDDALEIRRRVLFAFEAAEREPDPARQREWLTFAVVGGGPTGCELAGALAEVARHTLKRDFRNIRPDEAKVLLIEAQRFVLAPYSDKLRQSAVRQLEELGVEVRLSTRVTEIDGAGISLDGVRLPARTVIWAAGVAASPLGASLGAPLDRAGRVRVEPTLAIPGHDDVFVIGDLAAIKDDEGQPVPGVAPAAMQMGSHVAENLVRAHRREPLLPFHYVDKGSMATIGRARAVAMIGPVQLSGFFAWMAWLLLHLLFLIGFRSRAAVLASWAWAYLTFQRAGRLITGDDDPPTSAPR